MQKGDTVGFSDLEIGDYFCDDSNRKFRKIPAVELLVPGLFQGLLNAFDIRANARVALDPAQLVIFIKRSPWLDGERADPSIQESELEHQLESLHDYLETMERFLADEAQRYSRQLEEYPDDYQLDLEQTYQIGDLVVKGDLPWIEISELEAALQRVEELAIFLRSSFLVSLCAFLETKLKNECRSRQRDRDDVKLTLNDIHGRGIEKAKTYLVKVLGSSFPFGTSAHWREVQRYVKLRNRIVHDEGRVSDDPQLRKYVDSKDTLSFVSFAKEDFVVLHDSFCREALATIGALLKSMLYHRQADRIQ